MHMDAGDATLHYLPLDFTTSLLLRFPCVLGVLTHVIKLVRQVLYQVSLLLSGFEFLESYSPG